MTETLFLLATIAGTPAFLVRAKSRPSSASGDIVPIQRVPAHVRGLAALRSRVLTVVDIESRIFGRVRAAISHWPAARGGRRRHRRPQLWPADRNGQRHLRGSGRGAGDPGQDRPPLGAFRQGIGGARGAQSPAAQPRRLRRNAEHNGESSLTHLPITHPADRLRFQGQVKEHIRELLLTPNCLVVDDSKVIRKVARHILESLNLSA